MSNTEKQMIADQEASINYHSARVPDVAIREEEDGQYTVNGKLVYKDQNEKWICREELTTNEASAFRKHLSIKIGEGAS